MSTSTRATRKSGRVPTVSNTDSEMSDSAPTTNVPAPEIVPDVETSAPATETKKRAPKIMTEEETDFIAQAIEFLSAERSDTFWKSGFHDVIAKAVQHGPKNYAGKIAATAADALESVAREATKGGKKTKTPRKPSIQKVFALTPAFASLLESDVSGLTIEKIGKSINETLITENGEVGLTKPRALQIIWTIFGNYMKTATNKKGEPCYPSNADGKSHATWESADAMKKLPKELQKFLKTSTDKSVTLTGGQKFIASMCLTDKVIGTYSDQTTD